MVATQRDPSLSAEAQAASEPRRDAARPVSRTKPAPPRKSAKPSPITTAPTTIHCDNTAVLALIRRRHVNSRLRHYRVNLAFVFHAIELGLTRAAYCKTTVQRADFLTKALPVGAFRAAAAFVYPDYEFAKL